jgi:glucose-6-phosphate 1-dehydrogenase
VAGSINGRAIPDYLAEPGVNPESQTETFSAVKMFIDNWRWADVPFYVRTGKAMKKRLSEIIIEFRQPPLALFKRAKNNDPKALEPMSANSLSLRVQPNEGIRLHFGLKIPGPSMVLQATEMEFCYSDVFHADPPEAYERLILDTLAGDSTLFIRHDEVEAAWRFIDSISKGWAEHDGPYIYPYRAGGWGPHASDEFMQKDRRQWQNN